PAAEPVARLDPELAVVVQQTEHGVLRSTARVERAQHRGVAALRLEPADRRVGQQPQPDVDAEQDRGDPDGFHAESLLENGTNIEESAGGAALSRPLHPRSVLAPALLLRGEATSRSEAKP